MSPLHAFTSRTFEVACPKCGAERGERCRTLTTGRATDVHKARWERWAIEREWNRRKV